MPAAVEHHHRNTTKVSHKPFKPRFTSKSALKDRAKGKVERVDGKPRKTRHQEVMSKFDRKNQAKQKRITKHQDHAQITSIFTGRDGAPRNVVVIPLCNDVSAKGAARSLNKCLDLEDEILPEGITRISIDRFKQRLQYVTVQKDLISALNACRVADYVLFVLSATEEVDEAGEAMIRCIESQGVAHVYTAVQHLDQIDPPKKRPQTVGSLKSFITHFFPTQEKVFSLDSPQECQNLIRSLCTTTPRGIKWREDRSWLLAEDLKFDQDESSSIMMDSRLCTTAVMTGVVRGRKFRADRLMQVGDWGEFQVERVTAAPVEVLQKRKEAMSLDPNSADDVLDEPTEDQDTLEDRAPEETVMEDVDATAASVMTSQSRGVLLDDQHIFEEREQDEELQRPKRLPRGTSKYQSAWYLGDVSDSGSDLSDVEDDDENDAMTDTLTNGKDFDDSASGAALDPIDLDTEPPATEADTSLEDGEEEADLSAYRSSKRTAATEDLAFPDEIELPPTVLARDRLARYRGLKSAKTSPWYTEEDTPHQPEDWPRLLEISDYRAAKSRVLRETLIGGVKPGTRVQLHIRDLPLSLLRTYSPEKPLALFGLLRHERKQTPMDVSITLSSDATDPLKSKEELIAQIGPRRFLVNPLFSQAGATPNNVHKFERFLHPGRTAVASFVGPLTWGSVPVLFFKRAAVAKASGEEGMDVDATQSSSPELQLIATGTVLPSSSSPSIPGTAGTTPTSRIIAKRAILTGQPYKIHRRIVNVRYMFFNREDVEWFKALPLFTNHGARGVIKEALGTHGHFKCVFEGKVGVMDSVGVVLWKRVWPRPARRWMPGSDGAEGEAKVGMQEAPALVGA